MRLMLLGYLLIFLGLLVGPACSADGPPCGDTVCSADEVCENGQCILALIIEVNENEDEDGCLHDEDCGKSKVCTDPQSEPGATCIPRLPCDRDLDCQTGLQCGDDGLCR